MVDNTGLCDSCRSTYLPVVNGHERALASSVGIATTTKNPSTRLARIELAIQSCKELKQFEDRGFPLLGQNPATLLASLEDWFRKSIPVIINEVVATARQKSASAATDVARLRPYAVAQEQLIKLSAENSNLAEFAKAAVLVREEQDRLRFELTMRKAELSEMKGKPLKAVEYIMDALSGLSYDQTPDHAQLDLFERAANNLLRLGAEVPSGVHKVKNASQ